MPLLHYLEVENFKRFSEKQRIVLDHPTVLIGPNNCGKTTAMQALALWSQAVKTWWDVRQHSTAKERTSVGLNRLAIVSVPVQRTRFFWHGTHVRKGNEDIRVEITVGVGFKGKVHALPMRFRNQGDDMVYCQPDEQLLNSPEGLDLMAHAAGLDVALLYPMSGLEIDEPVLKPGRVDVLLGMGQTAQVLRNLCLLVLERSAQDWQAVVEHMQRLFSVQLQTPFANARGSVELYYTQVGVKEALDIAAAGRGFQQMLLMFAYLYSHKGSVLLVDEPDAHLEILRQMQAYRVLRDVADGNGSQVIMATHSEVVLNEALESNLSLILEGRVDNLASKTTIKNALRYFGAEHYLKARQCGHVLFVEGSTDVDLLRAFARRLNHAVAEHLEGTLNVEYTQDNNPQATPDANLEKAVKGDDGFNFKRRFEQLASLLPGLRGLAILDGDLGGKPDFTDKQLQVCYWQRYELENYVVSPEVLYSYALAQYPQDDLFADQTQQTIQAVLDAVVLREVFAGDPNVFKAWQAGDDNTRRVIWEAKTERQKLSKVAEIFFRDLADKLKGPMLLRKSNLYSLVSCLEPDSIAPEVVKKLDALLGLLRVVDVGR